MKIKRKLIVFSNIISLTCEGEIESWEEIVKDIRAVILANNLYSVAPPIFQYVKDDDCSRILTIYLSLNAPAELSDESPMTVMHELKFDDALVLRIGDTDEKAISEASLLLEACGLEMNVELERPFYYVALDVYGDKMLDIIAPIIGEKNNG
jgi:hypothetical protein